MNIQKTLFFLVAGLCLAAGISKRKPLTIYMIGDSTMADKLPEKFPETGWGMAFKDFFYPEVRVINRAKNGLSTKTFLEQNRWKPIVDSLKEGDYVFIEFGHNDSNTKKPEVFTSVEDYRINLLKFINDTKAKKAIPVLMTPLMNRRFNPDGTLKDSHGRYPETVISLAKEQQVYFIDMYQKSRKVLATEGMEPAKKLFLWGEPGQYSGFPQGVKDDTHFSVEGARRMAGLAIEGIKELKLPLSKYIKR